MAFLCISKPELENIRKHLVSLISLAWFNALTYLVQISIPVSTFTLCYITQQQL
jgi:hypothetical protein